MPNQNLFVALRAAFPSDLDSTAIETDDGLVYSWGDIDRATAMMANLLQSLDIPRDGAVPPRVAVQVEKSVEAVILYLATLRAGFVFLPLNTAYQSAEIEFKRGVYRVRGDVIDVFPAENAEHAVRISLFDDEIEGLTVFDPLTGHTRQKLGRFTVFPSSHYVTPRATVLQAIEKIKDELRERIEFFQSQQKLVECQRIEQRTRFDLEMLDQLGFCKGIENYSRHLAPGRRRYHRARARHRTPGAR